MQWLTSFLVMLADQVSERTLLADERLTLTDGWELIRAGAGVIDAPGTLDQLAEAWIPAVVPGTVAASLEVSGRWNWDSGDNLDSYDWWYRCRFAWNERSDDVVLVLDGLATDADVWLNGSHLLRSTNMFVRSECDVTTLLGNDNELVIRFRSLRTALSRKRPRPGWRTKLIDNQNLRWIRTTLLGHIPGWSATPQAIGPWRDVVLVRRGALSVSHRNLRTQLQNGDGVLHATIHLRLNDDCRVARATIATGNATAVMAITTEGKTAILRGTLRVPQAAAWWPHTHGTPSLHDVSLHVDSSAGSIDLPLGRVGFRALELRTEDGDFAVVVNGVPVFCRGACWSTVDAVRLGGTRDDYRAALTLARDAGMNMLRVGGTMVYETDDFYALCDELGIMIWQDFMFANMNYPGDDAEFIASVRTEVEQTLDGISAHPSLALLCGNSEVQQQASMLGLPRDMWTNSIFTDLIPSLIADRCPDVPSWPSSPSGGTLPFHVNAGDGHYFGHGPYRQPFADVRASGVRFASETLALANVPEPYMVDHLSCGSAGAGHHPVWKSGVPRDNGRGWDFEDIRDHYVAELFKVDPSEVRYADPERYLALGRVAGGELMARTIAEWRRADSTCNGALVWFYRDLRPGAGWGLLDSTGIPKAAYYYVRRASLPTAAFISDEGLNGLELHVVNDASADIDAEIRLALYRDGNTVVATATRPVTLEGRRATSFWLDDMFTGFVDINYAYRFGPPGHDAVVATIVSASNGEPLGEAFHFPLGLSSIHAPTTLAAVARRVDDRTYVLDVGASSLAVAVCIEVTGFLPEDNYFHLAPGARRAITLTALRGNSHLSGRVDAINARSAARIEVQ